MAKTLTVARQLASLNPEQRALAVSFARDLASKGAAPKRRKVGRPRKVKRAVDATAAKPGRQSKPRVPKAPPRVKPLPALDDEE